MIAYESDVPVQLIEAEPADETKLLTIGEDGGESVHAGERELAEPVIDNEFRYTFGEENPVPLSMILGELGIEEEIEEVGQAIDDEHPEGMVKFVDVVLSGPLFPIRIYILPEESAFAVGRVAKIKYFVTLFSEFLNYFGLVWVSPA